MAYNVKPEIGPAWSPKIAAFVCNWRTYTGADLAGTSRLKMDAKVRVSRPTCSSRVNPLFITKAFERDADGVIVSGCDARAIAGLIRERQIARESVGNLMNFSHSLAHM